MTEHKRATRNGDTNNHIAVHHLQTNHRIDWDSAKRVTHSTGGNLEHHWTVTNNYLHFTNDLSTTDKQ